jgi:hypothetical protein
MRLWFVGGVRHSLVASNTTAPVVSMTTHGPRLKTVDRTIRSIGTGRLRPSRLILWVNPDVDVSALPDRLLRLRARGLEILNAPENLGPHTKYYPYAVTFGDQDHQPLVTADDDILYPRSWLKQLSLRQFVNTVTCHRAHRITMMPDGRPKSYLDWRVCRTAEPSKLNFATGVMGVLYPRDFVRALREDQEFKAKCPRADDVWLHVKAIRLGYSVLQVGDHPASFPMIRRAQSVSLVGSNAFEDGNDKQIVATYGPQDLKILAEVQRA